jgi:hypothetical protein
MNAENTTSAIRGEYIDKLNFILYAIEAKAID